MKLLFLALALLAPLPATAQTTPAKKLPPANALPYENSEEAAVLAPIHALFAALEAGDREAVLRTVYPEGRATAVATRADGTKLFRPESFATFAARITPETAFTERMWNPAIEIDGDIAMVWAPFDVKVKGKLVSCGTNHIDLVRQNGAWKIMNATFTSRATGCEAR